MELNFEIENLVEKLNSKRHREVIDEAKESIKKYPNIFVFYNIIGLAYQGIGNLEEAKLFFLKAIEKNPKEIGPKNNLANTYVSLGKFDEANKLFIEILSKVKKSPIIYINYAHLKKKINDYKSALQFVEKAISIDENNLEYYEELANIYQSLGNFNKSKEICAKILEKNQKYIPAHIILSRQIDYKENKNNLDKMVELHKKEKLSLNNKIKICFAIGKAYEDQNNYEKSFKFIEEANNLQDKKVEYKLENDKKLFKSIKKIFSKTDPKKYKINFNEKKIIFIVGLPRSGTTLVEQILSSHSKVDGAGELIYLKKSIDKTFVKENIISEYLLNQEINSEKNIINDLYFNFLKSHSFSKNIITDKAPQNFMWIGFIRIFFPNAKVIHCCRNSNDNFLSLYKNNFASNQHMGWTFNPKKIVSFYNLYSDLIKFWKVNYNNFLYEINYDKLVIDQHSEIEKLLNYCELEFENECFNHHKNKSPITTVSMYQARKPIYKSSLNSSKTYRKYLDKYYNELNKVN